MTFNPFPTDSPKIGPTGPINSKHRRRIALFSIDVKFGTIIDYIFSPLLAEFQIDY